jgi:hypothetical protein
MSAPQTHQLCPPISLRVPKKLKISMIFVEISMEFSKISMEFVRISMIF